MAKLSEIEQIQSTLKEAHRRNNLVIFVGSGCTAATVEDTTNHPSATWAGLIQEGITFGKHRKLLNKEESRYIELQLRYGDYVGAATYLAEKLEGQSSSHFKDWLGNSIGNLPTNHVTLIEALSQLRVPILTTNYDNLIEQITNYDSYHQESNPLLLQELVQGYRDGVMHLHGIWNEPQTVVFNLISYFRATENRPLQELIRSLLVTKTVLFIGFGKGLDDPNLGPLIKNYKIDFGRQHYQLVREIDVPKYQEIVGVKRVAFGKTYADLEPFLRSLLTKSSEELKDDFLTGIPTWKYVLDSVYLNKKWPKQQDQLLIFNDIYADLQELLRIIKITNSTTPTQKDELRSCIERMEAIVSETISDAHHQRIASDKDLGEWLIIKDITNQDIIKRLSELP